MEFAVINADYRNIQKYKDKLLKYNAELQTIINIYDVDWYYNII